MSDATVHATTARELLALRRPHRIVLACAAGLALVLVLLQLHGFSLAVWHQVLEGPGAATPEVLIGKPRAIRIDDWMVQLPFVLAQRAHDPRYPVVNTLVANGQPLMIPLAVPVADPLVLFKPGQWGYFVSADTGLAWMWWLRVLGLLVVWWLVLRVVTEGQDALAAAGALALLAAPLLQFMSLNAAPLLIHAGLCFLAGAWVLCARTLPGIGLASLVLGWSGGCFLLGLYPPFQLMCGVVFLALAGGFLWRHHADLPSSLRAARFAGLGFAVVLAGTAVVGFVSVYADAIAAVRGSVYPGARISTGGDMPLASLFSAHVAAGPQVHDWGVLWNICDAASLWIAFPAALAAIAWNAWRARRGGGDANIDGWAAGLLLLCLALTLYIVVGVPPWLARATGLSLVPARRAILGLGVLDLLLVLRFAAIGTRLAVVPAAAIGALFALGVAAGGVALGGLVEGLALPSTLALATTNGALVGWLLASRRRAVPMAAIAVALLLSTGWFNPLVRGGSDVLLTSDVARAVLAEEERAGEGTRWVTYGSSFGTLLPAIGVRTLNGIVPVPDLALWEPLDPRGRYTSSTNRYAYFDFQLTKAQEPKFVTIQTDAVLVRVRPDAPALRELGVTHALVVTRRGTGPRTIPGLEHVTSVGNAHVYRLLPLAE